MREQAIPSRGSRRSAAQGKGFVQRPTRRDGRAPASRIAFLRPLIAYVPSVIKVGLAIAGVIALVIGYRFAASASFFQIKSVDVTGTSRASAEEIEAITRRAVARTGVWRADLAAISSELGRLPGVRRAVVSRVLPEGLRVRVTERVPVAVVRTASGNFVWVDEEAVLMGEMKPSDQIPAFFIRGWDEEGTNEAAKENVERIQKYQEALREWTANGLAERVSEVNLMDIRDVRAQLAGHDSGIEVRLGSDLKGQLKTALELLDEYKGTPLGNSIIGVDFQNGRWLLRRTSGGNVTAGRGDREIGR